jgi:hypothetical protein
MVGCSKGFEGCPGKIPLAWGQCKSHKCYAKMKAKMTRGQGRENVWIKAVKNLAAGDFSPVLRKRLCPKECCSMIWLPSQQVANQID